MSVIGGVFDSLKTMSLLQLLMAFVACTGYAVAQGGLLGSRGRRVAWILAAVGAIGFSLESTQPGHAATLLAFAVAGLGLFVATVWLTSRTLGFQLSREQLSHDDPPPNPGSLRSGDASQAGHPGAPAHSL